MYSESRLWIWRTFFFENLPHIFFLGSNPLDPVLKPALQCNSPIILRAFVILHYANFINLLVVNRYCYKSLSLILKLYLDQLSVTVCYPPSLWPDRWSKGLGQVFWKQARMRITQHCTADIIFTNLVLAMIDTTWSYFIID